MNDSGWRRTLVQGIEAVLAVGLVMLFFLVLLGIIGLSFPEGTSLNGLMFQSKWASSSLAPSSVDLEVGPGAELIASLIETRRTVKDKAPDGIVWNSSRRGMPLAERHAVQTLERSGATISFGYTDRLTLEQNSLVVIRRLEPSRGDRPRRASVIALEGRLRGRIEGSGSEEMQLEVVTGSGTTTARPDGGNLDVAVTVNSDRTSTFTVMEGSAEVSSAGRTVLLGPNQTVTVAADQPPSEPVFLPGPPSPLSPSHDSVVLFHNARPDVRFAWTEPSGAEGYRIVISRDPEFEDIVFEQQLNGPELVHENLQQGVYYWRVAGLAGRASGPPGPVRAVHLVRDDQPPALAVAFPAGPVNASAWLLAGEAEPGSRVFIGDRAVPVARSGQFEYTLDLERGLNVVVVEAVDPAGNIAYRSEIVNAKY